MWNPEGISKESGKGGKPALWLSMLSTLCHFHGLLFRGAASSDAARSMKAEFFGVQLSDLQIAEVDTEESRCNEFKA